MDTSLPTTRTTRRPSRPPNRQEASRPHNHHLRPRRSPRTRPTPRNTPNSQRYPRHHNPHQDNNLTNTDPHLILQAARGQTPLLGQKIAKTEYHETPRRHPCAKHRKITILHPKKTQNRGPGILILEVVLRLSLEETPAPPSRQSTTRDNAVSCRPNFLRNSPGRTYPPPPDPSTSR